MPLTLTPIDNGGLCHGSAWAVDDEVMLAHSIARVALGQARHVQHILAGADLAPPPTTATQLQGAIRLLTVESGEDPWHRDGWMFQVMSWIAAQRARPGLATRLPQMIKADKGFDGLQMELDADSGDITAVIIFEDKATDYPRDTVRDKVWPELRGLEAGERDNELVAHLTTLLEIETRRHDIDVDAAIGRIVWERARRYQISVTVGPTHACAAGRARLFEGYDEIALGGIDRRGGNTFLVPELRPFMARLAALAIDAASELAVTHV